MLSKATHLYSKFGQIMLLHSVTMEFHGTSLETLLIASKHFEAFITVKSIWESSLSCRKISRCLCTLPCLILVTPIEIIGYSGGLIF